jgi:hypothetical protein
MSDEILFHDREEIVDPLLQCCGAAESIAESRASPVVKGDPCESSQTFVRLLDGRELLEEVDVREPWRNYNDLRRGVAQRPVGEVNVAIHRVSDIAHAPILAAKPPRSH